ncbi:hypothetical protein RJ639_042789 [Escallonia herrerae]|uniref:Pentatricopeptide repeat-containing protein n=1 Tax=Escallonia herrerae TaxID=1293975 RepID=A0AA89B770_9ASTE|nr:hypothetical protein RJ639_042789 [Escallonia herrerae]
MIRRPVTGIFSRFFCHSTAYAEPISLLQQRHSSKSIAQCKQIHAKLIITQSFSEAYVANTLLGFYSKCGDLYSAHQLFDEIPHKNVVTWTSMISSYVQHGSFHPALGLFKEMLASNEIPNHYTLSVAVRACTVVGYVDLGVQIHGLIVCVGLERDEFAGSSLLDFYFKVMGDLDSAFRVFDGLYRIDVVTRNVMISGLAQDGDTSEVLRMLSEMQVVDGLTPNDSTIVDAGKICEAEKLFRRIDDRDIVAWNAMITGCAQVEEGSAATCISFFQELCRTTMLEPDGATLFALLKSCQSISDLVVGIQIHAMICKLSLGCETRMGNAVINMYSRFGAVDDAYKAFNDIVSKDDVSWSSVIGNYQQNGFVLDALRLCKVMMADGMVLTNFSLPLCIAACAELAVIDLGKQLHSFVFKLGFHKDIYVGSSIIDMYAKCGNIENSQKAFEDLKEPNEVIFNAMISGFSQHGNGFEAIRVFREMEKMNLAPNQVTLSAVLSACSHVGLTEEALRIFYLIRLEYNLKPEPEHYTCLVDVLGRAGRLEEAYKITGDDGSLMAWKALLSACRIYGNSKMAEKCAGKVTALDPSDDAPYVLLSNLYSEEGKWENALKLRQTMSDMGVKKNPGSSHLINRDGVHNFAVTFNPRTK